MKAEERYKKLCFLFKKVEYYPTNDSFFYNGFLINNKIIVGKLQNKWRNVGKAKWYYFRIEEDLLKYIN
jgi:hypothetical protein